MKRLNPLNDFMFKKIFGEEKDKELLISFLNSILNAEIVDIKIENEKLNRDKKNDKLGILDINAKTNFGEKINVEVQLLDQKNMIPRTLFYWSKLYVEDFKIRGLYNNLERTITINILDFKLDELKDESFHSTYRLHESKSMNLLTDLLEIHFIELPKFDKIGLDMHNSLHRWLLFLRKDAPVNELKEVIVMDNLVNKAEEKLTRLSADPETRREYERIEKALTDERNRLEDAKNEGIKEGILEVAKNLLEDGMSLSKVAEYTGISEERLSELLKK